MWPQTWVKNWVLWELKPRIFPGKSRKHAKIGSELEFSWNYTFKTDSALLYQNQVLLPTSSRRWEDLSIEIEKKKNFLLDQETLLSIKFWKLPDSLMPMVDLNPKLSREPLNKLSELAWQLGALLMVKALRKWRNKLIQENLHVTSD